MFDIFSYADIVVEALQSTKGTIVLVLVVALGLGVLQTVYCLCRNAFNSLIGDDLRYRQMVQRQEANRVRRERFRNWEEKHPHVRQNYRRRYGG